MRLSRRAGDGPGRRSATTCSASCARRSRSRATSDGAFDVTVGPLSLLWRQRAAPGCAAGRRAPCRGARARRPRQAGARRARGRSGCGTPGMQLDLGRHREGLRRRRSRRSCSRSAASRARSSPPAATSSSRIAPPDREGWRVAVASIEGADRPPAGLRHAAQRRGLHVRRRRAVRRRRRRPLLAHLRSAHRPGADRPPQRDGRGAQRDDVRRAWRRRCR